MAIVRRTARSVGLVRSRSSGNTIRPVEWIRFCDAVPTTVLPGTISGQDIVTAAEFDDFTRPTVVRIRGVLNLRVITDAAVSFLTWGITIVNPNEPPPDPFAQRRGNRWLWWGCGNMASGASASEPIDGASWINHFFDVKSMRKRLVDGSSLSLVVLNDAGGSGSVNVHIGASTLVKE